MALDLGDIQLYQQEQQSCHRQSTANSAMTIPWLEQTLKRKGDRCLLRYSLGSQQDKQLTNHTRLDGHNQPLINIAGFTIHPTIRSNLPKQNLQVADLGTGSGSFLRTIAQELSPDSTLHGFDLSSAAFLNHSQLPSNIKLKVLDVKQPPPPQLQARYDVIFLRFLNIGMQPEDWAKVAKTAFLMLKPGGRIQWYEGKIRDCRFPLQSTSSSSITALREGFGMWFDSMPEMDYCFDHLSHLLEETGFEDVEIASNSTDRKLEYRIEYNKYWIGAMKAGLLMRIKAGLRPAPPGEVSLDELVERCHRDNETGGYVRFNTQVWVARKP